MNNFMIGVLAILATITIFFASRWLNRKFPHPLTLPVLVSTIAIASGLLIFNISYDTYFIGGQWIDRFLGPAVVALAYPLYQQREIIKQYTFIIFVGVFIGSVIGVFSGLMMGKWLNLDPLIIKSVLPKSVTSPVAMDIAYSIGASPALAVVLVMVAGISGAVMGPTILRWAGVHDHLAKGLGMGSASHAIGTAKSMEMNVQQGAASTIAMILCAIIVSIITPILVVLFL
ncbi:LrgB family protein [Lederbergia citrea]|uniref:LrgB family protein n=1 Tax=Lederbergia citrea TaxID=2833581 RepID=UPI001BC92293|nr:LrgB family protein [Lederbergia citrea]MBS4179534.1 LrgB family protein [Lederbergia citrea]